MKLNTFKMLAAGAVVVSCFALSERAEAHGGYGGSGYGVGHHARGNGHGYHQYGYRHGGYGYGYSGAYVVGDPVYDPYGEPALVNDVR